MKSMDYIGDISLQRAGLKRKLVPVIITFEILAFVVCLVLPVGREYCYK